MEKSFDRKLAEIRANSSSREFILADAKDADMGFGIPAPGLNRSDSGPEYRTLSSYRQSMRDITEQGLVDIMLMSVSSSEILALEDRIFDQSAVTPAIRANDTTDIWLGMSGDYQNQPSIPFRTTTIEQAQCGKISCTESERAAGVDLGLYSITFNNHAESDVRSLEQYRAFRIEAEQKGFRHFLEVFAPNAPLSPILDTGRFVNDHIARCVAGVPKASRPLFLKIPYFGAKAMDELVSYDPSLVVGILGGSSGTTHDAFHLLWEAKKYGARAALFGRKINNSEHQTTFVRFLRAVADDQLKPNEAVQEYHAALSDLRIAPIRELKDDLVLA